MNTKRPHHYYKVATSTETGTNLQALMDKCDEVSEQARQWAEKQGATSYLESPEGIAGGIAALEIENCLSKEGLERVVMPNGGVIFMPAPDSELEKEMYALPIVSETEFIHILQLKPRLDSKGKQMPFTFGNTTPVCFKHNDYWYVDMPYECAAQDIVTVEEKEFYCSRLAALNRE